MVIAGRTVVVAVLAAVIVARTMVAAIVVVVVAMVAIVRRRHRIMRRIVVVVVAVTAIAAYRPAVMAGGVAAAHIARAVAHPVGVVLVIATIGRRRHVDSGHARAEILVDADLGDIVGVGFRVGVGDLPQAGPLTHGLDDAVVINLDGLHHHRRGGTGGAGGDGYGIGFRDRGGGRFADHAVVRCIGGRGGRAARRQGDDGQAGGQRQAGGAIKGEGLHDRLRLPSHAYPSLRLIKGKFGISVSILKYFDLYQSLIDMTGWYRLFLAPQAPHGSSHQLGRAGALAKPL